jgi:hypothetical protein
MRSTSKVSITRESLGRERKRSLKRGASKLCGRRKTEQGCGLYVLRDSAHPHVPYAREESKRIR